MTQRDILLANIEAYLVETKMGPTWFGHLVCRDSHLVQRLRKGGDVNTGTAAKIWHFLNEKGSWKNGSQAEQWLQNRQRQDSQETAQ